MATTTNRRTLLTAARTLPVVAIASPALANVAPAAAPSADDRTTWDRLVREYREVRDLYQRLGADFGEKESQFFERKETKKKPSEPATPPLDMNRSLADIVAGTPERSAAWKRYEDELAMWKAETAAIRTQIIGDSEARWYAALNLRDKTMTAIRQFPVSSLAMLREKADILHAEYDGALDDDDALALVADIRRLADQEG